MKGQRLIRAGLVALLVAAGAAAGFAGPSATLNLQGRVAAKLDISVTAETVASGLNLEASQTNLLVATVTEKCNRPGGYTVSVQSANLGSLKGMEGNTDTVAYTMTYGGAAISLTAGGATVTPDGTKTGPSGISKEVRISYTGNDFLTEDTYTDTLTFTIAAE